MEVPVSHSPQPAGSWRWIGTKTLLFDPDIRFPMATEYKVTIAEGTKSANDTRWARTVSVLVMTRVEYCQSLAIVAVLLAASTASAEQESLTLHAEVDPLPFVLGGYGIQVGLAHSDLPGWRFGLGNFSLDVPDAGAQLNSDNEGFHIRLRHSRALYGLRFFSGLKGWCVGGALRALRQRFTHDDAPGQSQSVREFSAEAIGGYKYHPLDSRFYIMPWISVAKTLHSDSPIELAGYSYERDFVQFFATANLGLQF